MSRSIEVLRACVCAVALGAAVTAAITGCGVTVGPASPPGPYYDGYPPDAYIATTTPYYYEGHATYWYGNRWYYRDGGRWSHYEREPSGLRDHRGDGGRRTYERGGHPGGGRPGGGHPGGQPAGGHGGHR